MFQILHDLKNGSASVSAIEMSTTMHSSVLYLVTILSLSTKTNVLSINIEETSQKPEANLIIDAKPNSIHNDNGTKITDTLNSTEECVGGVEYCNMTKEEYVSMLNDYIYPQTYEWVLIGTHTAVFIMGLVGNALVCIAVYRNHTMRTVTNYFIVNLAVADFMVILFCLPPTVLWDVTETWFLGDALCKILLYFQVSSTQI